MTEVTPEVELPAPPLPAAPVKEVSGPDDPPDDRTIWATDQAAPAPIPADDAPAPARLVNLRDRSRDLASGIRRYKAEAKRGSAAEGGE